jgi:hypothetical protein
VVNSPEDALAQAERHVREGEARIARQIALIEELDRKGHQHVADTARELLDIFQSVLQTWRGDLARIAGRTRLS